MIQRLRLFSGLVLLAYVTSHLLNHAVGIFSLETAEVPRQWFIAFWRFPWLTEVLYASLLGHISLALWAIYQRHTLRLPRWELIRLTLGLLIPLGLTLHLFATRIPHELFAVNDNYSREIATFWVLNRPRGVLQFLLLLVAWTHGWIGIYYWLRVKPRAAGLLPALRAAGVLIPALALMGFVGMGREVSVLAENATWLRGAVEPLPAGAPEALNRGIVGVLLVYVGLVAAAFVARWVRTAWQRRGARFVVTYPDGRRTTILPGTSLLEASRMIHYPHASQCGGRARCSTCRTRCVAEERALPPPGLNEAGLLRRIGAPADVRLACQTRPTGDVEIFPLLPPSTHVTQQLLQPGSASSGAERELAVLFADMRAFTRFAERRLPYDVVFVLNQWNAALGRAIEAVGGLPNQFMGDGIMALFGVDVPEGEACRAAMLAAAEMARAVAQLNETLAHDLPEPLRIGIGIHIGHVIIGEMGYGRGRQFTAIGDVVNTASRLETLTKDYSCQVVVSEQVALAGGADLSAYPSADVQVRGRTQPLRIRIVANALDLAAALNGAPSPADP
jgi:adenylate cyclase